MPTTKNRIQILNLHPKKHGINKEEKTFWGGCIFAKILPVRLVIKQENFIFYLGKTKDFLLI